MFASGAKCDIQYKNRNVNNENDENNENGFSNEEGNRLLKNTLVKLRKFNPKSPQYKDLAKLYMIKDKQKYEKELSQLNNGIKNWINWNINSYSR